MVYFFRKVFRRTFLFQTQRNNKIFLSINTLTQNKPDLAQCAHAKNQTRLKKGFCFTFYEFQNFKISKLKRLEFGIRFKD